MAKRKRLTPAQITGMPETPGGGLETKSMRPPIAQVAGTTAERAALEEVSHALSEARSEGRLIAKLPLAQIVTDHLVRDRLSLDAADMKALSDSLKARGQQTAIEVVELPEGRYGLISGWRRVEALRALGEATVLALVRAPETSSDAYVAMIEENEIRASLSFYERARLAAEAAQLGIYRDTGRAVQALFANASASKRSKINSFVVVHEALGKALTFPTAIPERIGLALAGALERDAGFAVRVKDVLRKTPPQDASVEREALERALRKQPTAKPAPKPKGREVARGVFLEAGRGKVALSGQGVDAAFQRDLEAWLAAR